MIDATSARERLVRFAESLRRDKSGGDGMPPLLPRTWSEKHASLSYAQQRLWFLERMEPQCEAYRAIIAIEFRGELNLILLRSSIERVVQRHESLRTVFRDTAEGPEQVVLDRPVLDFSAVDCEFDAKELETRALEFSREPLDISLVPPLRVRVLRHAHEASLQVMLLALHHIIADGWSLGVFGRELVAIYEALRDGKDVPLEELSVQYRDYALWQREWLQGEVLERQLTYWTQQMKDAPPLELPADYPRPAVARHRGASVTIGLREETTNRLKQLAREQSATIFMVLLASFQLVLARYSGQDDISVGTDVANRNAVETEGSIGFFVNQLVLRTRVDPNENFRELLARVRRTSLDAIDHQDIPFERLVEALAPQRDLGRSPLFQAKLVMHTAPQRSWRIPGLEIRQLRMARASSQLDLSFEVQEEEGRLSITAEYDSDLYRAATVWLWAEGFQDLLERVEATSPVRTLIGPGEAERRLVGVYGFNRTEKDYGAEGLCLHELCEIQAARTPEAAALRYEGAQLTYGELDRQANRMAHALMALGVRSDTLVGVCPRAGAWICLFH